MLRMNRRRKERRKKKSKKNQKGGDKKKTKRDLKMRKVRMKSLKRFHNERDRSWV